MSKIRERNEEGWYHYEFNCPGCKYFHGIYVNREGYKGPVWDFNGNLDKPTVNPSILMRTSWMKVPHVCHSYIKDGMIQFLGDCTHSLAGQTVELPEIESLII